MTADEVLTLIDKVGEIRGEVVSLRRDIERVWSKTDDHGALLAQILDRLPERRTDHHRDDDPPEGKGGVPWGLVAKVGGAIGVAIGSAVAGLLSAPAVSGIIEGVSK